MNYLLVAIFNISIHTVPQCCVYIFFIPWMWIPDLTPMQLTTEISQGHTAAEQQESAYYLQMVLTLISVCLWVAINPGGTGTIPGTF